MDPLALLEFGSNGLILAVVLTAFRFAESQKAKKNGGTVYDRVNILSEKIASLSERVSVMEVNMGELVGELEKLTEYNRAFHRDFMIHRENVRLQWAKDEGAKEALKERKFINE
jgi:hypothetical protein